MRYFRNIDEDKVYALEEAPEGNFEEFTLADVEARNAAAESAAFDALSYAEKRRMEYPSVEEQLEALFDAGVFPPQMAAQIEAVRAKYPKGNQ